MRDGLEAKFLREVDPNNELPDSERLCRADAARRALPAPSFSQREGPQGPQGHHPPHRRQGSGVTDDYKEQPPRCGQGGYRETPGEGDWFSAVTLAQPADIARGPAGDCCILCGKVGIDLPPDHGCKPTIDVEASRAQLDHALGYDKRGAA